MADVSRDVLRGVLVADPRITEVWAAQSTYDEAGLRPGVPEPQRDTRLTLQAVGTQTAAKELRIRAHRGGFPEPGGGSFRWQYQGDASTKWRGWDIPTIISAWEAVQWTDGTGTVVACNEPQAISLPTGEVIVAHAQQISTGNAYGVQVRKRSTAGVWSDVRVYDQVADASEGVFGPCVVALPTGRLLLFVLVEDTTAAEAQVRMYYSDDTAASWSLGQRAALDTAIDQQSVSGAGNAGYDIQRMRAAYKDGQVLLLIQARAHNTSLTIQDTIFQFASDDLGARFTLVDTTPNNVTIYNYQDIAVAGEFFVVGLIGPGSAGSTRAAVIKLANAYEPISDQTAINALGDVIVATISTTKFLTDGEMAIWLDDDGVLYMSVRRVAGDEYLIVRSLDEGATWAPMGSGITVGTDNFGPWWDSDDTSTHPTQITGCSQGGRQLILHKWDASPGNEDNSLGCVYLGGYSTITMPGLKQFPVDLSRVGFASTWLPFDKPADVGWTASGAGTNALVSPGALEVVTAAQDRSFVKTPAGTVAQGIIARFTVNMVSGGDITTSACAFEVRLADAGQGYDVAIRFSTTQFRVTDVNGATTIATVTVDMTAGVQILVGMEIGKVRTWYRLVGTGGDRNWTVGPSSTALTNDAGAGGVALRLRWAHIANGTATSRWTEVHYTDGAYVGLGLADGFTNPDDLYARTFSETPVWVDDGVRLQATDGPAFADETWHVDTRSDYAVEHMIPTVAPSPRKRFRSATAGVQEIAFAIAGAAESFPGSSLIGLYLDGCNWRNGSLKGYTGAAWVTLVTIDLAKNRSSLDYVRKGSAIMPDTGASIVPKHYFHLNELAGGYADLGSSKLRRIIGNTEGVWDDATTRRVIVFLDPDDIDETEPASGTIDLVMPRGLVLTSIANATYQGFMLRINAAGIDAYSEVGVALFGWMVPFGAEPSWGRTWEIEANADLVTARDGSRRGRTRGPRRRAVELAWPDGVDARQLYQSPLAPDYLVGSTVANNAPVALRYDTPYVLAGLLDQLEGPVKPLVYVESFPKSTVAGTDDIVYVQARRSLYGRLVSSVQLDTVLGDETDDEVLRVQTIRIEEEV